MANNNKKAQDRIPPTAILPKKNLYYGSKKPKKLWLLGKKHCLFIPQLFSPPTKTPCWKSSEVASASVPVAASTDGMGRSQRKLGCWCFGQVLKYGKFQHVFIVHAFSVTKIRPKQAHPPNHKKKKRPKTNRVFQMSGWHTKKPENEWFKKKRRETEEYLKTIHLCGPIDRFLGLKTVGKCSIQPWM